MKKQSVRLMAIVCSLAVNSGAMAATTAWTGPGSDFNTAGNWSAGVPTDDASFNSALPTTISLSAVTSINSLTFNAGAAAYTLTVPDLAVFQGFILNGPGIINNSANTPTFIVNGSLEFISGTAANAVIVNQGQHLEFDNSTAGNATITNSSLILMVNFTSAGNATITNTGSNAALEFSGNSTAGNATLTNNGGLIQFAGSATGGNATINNGVRSTLQLIQNGTLGNATVNNNGSIDASNLTASGWTAGSISGSGNLNLGATTLVVGSNNLDTTYTGNISGIFNGVGGSLWKVGNGTLTLGGSNSYTGVTNINVGTLNLLGSLAGNVTVAASASLSGTGTMGNLVNNGTVAPGVNGSGTLTSSGYSGHSIFNSVFNGSSHGALRVLGNADITGDTLSVTGTNFAVGNYSLVSANSLTGPFATFNGPTSSLLIFTPQYSATEARLLINFTTPFTSFAQNTNQRNLSLNLEGQKTTSTADFTSAINTLAVLPAAQIPNAYAQISGDSLASFQAVGLQNATAFTRGMRDRVLNISTGSYGLWGQGVGRFDTMKADSAMGSPASQTTTGGFQAGCDEFFADNLVFGLSGGYTQSSLDITDRASSGNTQSIQSGIYLGYRREGWFANGSGAYIADSNDMTRGLHFGTINEQATSNFDSRQFTTSFEVGYSFQRQKQNLSIEPSLSLRQDHLVQDGFTESGAPGLGLTVADQTLNSFVSSMGVGFKHIFNPEARRPVGLKASIAWEHELADTHDALSAHFAETSGGSDFTVEGTPRSRDAAVIGLNGGIPLHDNVELFGDYSATLASVQTGQKILGGVQFTW